MNTQNASEAILTMGNCTYDVGTDEWEIAYMEQLRRENAGLSAIRAYASNRIATIKARMGQA